MRKTMRVYVNLEGFDKTETGLRKVWRTDGVQTYACSFEPCYFIWEKGTKHNGYEPYSGYVSIRDVQEVK